MMRDMKSSETAIPLPSLAQPARVTLIRPPKLKSRSAPDTHDGVPPLSLAYLTAALRRAGHRVRCIDAFGEAPRQVFPIADTHLVAYGLTAEQIAERVPADTQIIGISCLFSQEWVYYKEVIRAVHRARPGCPIVLGGEHATADSEHILRSCPEVVCCVRGEGEETLIELVAALRAGAPLAQVAGIVHRNASGEIASTPGRRRIKAVDEIAWPSWDALPLATYLDNHLGYQEVNHRSIPMLASRGCPYQCTFCSSANMWGTRWYARDPMDVVREIKHYQQEYAVSNVEFYDLTAIVDRRWILRFTELLIQEDLGITWTMPSGTRSEALDEEVLIQLKRSGCTGIVYAPESGSPTTLRKIKKRVDPEKMLKSLRAAVKHGHQTRAHIIFGFPDQDLKQVLETYWFVLRMLVTGLHDVLMFPFCPYPGNEIFFGLVKEGAIDPNSESYDAFLATSSLSDREITSWSNHFSARAISGLCVGGMAVFYFLQFLLRPQRAVSTISNLVRRKPVTWFERFVSKTAPRMMSRRLALGSSPKP